MAERITEIGNLSSERLILLRGGYSDLCKAFEIHNRLMHPNSPLKKSVE
jgi:hypothetical protein